MRKTLSQQFAKHELDDQSRFTDTQAAIDRLGASIPIAVADAVRETVNGKIDKISMRVEQLTNKLDTNTNDTKWIRTIGTYAASVLSVLISGVAIALGWGVLEFIKFNGQVSAMAATLKALSH